MEYVVCDLCSGTEQKKLWEAPDRLTKTGDVFTVVECLKCGLTFVNPRPLEKEMSKYYKADYPSFILSSGVASKLKKILLRREVKFLRKRFSNGCRIFEVGAGSGEDLAYLKTEGFEVSGSDMSSYAVAEAEKLGLTLFTGDVTSLSLTAQSFDAVRMKYVLSHVHSPRKNLEKIAEIIRSGGVLFLWIPSIDSFDAKLFGSNWEGGEVPRHLYDFTPATISRYLEDAGFVVEKISHSIVPNTFIHSFRNFLQERGLPVSIWNINFFTLAVFFPISFIAAVFKKSDRLTVLARKK